MQMSEKDMCAQVLPDLSEDRWSYNGTATVHGQEANSWVAYDKKQMGYGEIVSTYTMYVSQVWPACAECSPASSHKPLDKKELCMRDQMHNVMPMQSSVNCSLHAETMLQLLVPLSVMTLQFMLNHLSRAGAVPYWFI